MAPTLSAQTRAFIEAPRFGVLGTTQADGTPQLTVMWYELQGDVIMMNTTVARAKAANLRRDPRIALCIEDGYSYVTLYGTATLDDDHATSQADIRRLAARYHNEAKAEQMMRDQFSAQQRLTIRMQIERVVEHW